MKNRINTCVLTIAVALALCSCGDNGMRVSGANGVPGDLSAGDAGMQGTTAASAPVVLSDVVTSYPWSGNLVADQFTEFPAVKYRPYVQQAFPGGFLGSNPYDAPLDAYSDPAYDETTGKQYIFGGGHSDGTMNAVVAFDHSSLSFSTAFAPTPPAKYPPSYSSNGSVTDIVYPSGAAGNGYFRDDLTASSDTPYNTPYAKGSSHVYASASVLKNRIYYFYGTYGEFDIASGSWIKTNVDLGAQLHAAYPQYSSVPLQQGTVSVADPQSGKLFVTVVSGDAGDNWRSDIIAFDPTTRKIEGKYGFVSQKSGQILSSITMTIVGRDIYGFTKLGTNQYRMNQGFIFNMDSRTFKNFVLAGDVTGSDFANSSTQETIPAWYDGVAIRRWNYSSTEKNHIYSVDPKPVSGSGTENDPYILQQKVRTIGGTVPGTVSFVYKRMVWNPRCSCAILLAAANQPMYALRLSDGQTATPPPPPPPPPTSGTGNLKNAASRANGGVASASTTINQNYPVTAVNDGERSGKGWGAGGGWNDATIDSFPDWVQIDFAKTTTLSEIDIFTVQDAYTNPQPPTEAMTFSSYGITDFKVQYWDGANWITVPGGAIAGNNKVWRKLTFGELTTNRIRVTVSNALSDYSRITEIEAYGYDAATQSPPPAPQGVDVAASSNGATATASSTYGSNYPAAAAIDKDRRGLNWGNGGGWNDASFDGYPDSLQVNFNAVRSISEIDVFTLQDNYLNPVEPDLALTFTQYGVTDFTVEYWNGSAWTTIPNGIVSGNNHVWKKFTFPAVSTNAIRVNVTGALNDYSRITEIEAY